MAPIYCQVPGVFLALISYSDLPQPELSESTSA